MRQQPVSHSCGCHKNARQQNEIPSRPLNDKYMPLVLNMRASKKNATTKLDNFGIRRQ